MKRSLNYYLERHPFLYKLRFILISKELDPPLCADRCYNDINHKMFVPGIYFETNENILQNINSSVDELSKAIQIATWLRNNIKGGKGFGYSSSQVLKKMLNGEGGVCSDFSQVFNNFCLINDIKVKEWGLTVRPFSKHFQGHTFNEIYSSRIKKWVFIDITQSILFFEKNSDIPLSTLELFSKRRKNNHIFYHQFNMKFPCSLSKIKKNYINQRTTPFLIANYCNKTYDRFLDALKFLPISIIHGIIFLMGKSYRFEFPVLYPVEIEKLPEVMHGAGARKNGAVDYF